MRQGIVLLVIMSIFFTQTFPLSNATRYNGVMTASQFNESPLLFSTYLDNPWSNPPIFSYAEMDDYGKDVVLDKDGNIILAGEIGSCFLSKITSTSPYHGYYHDLTRYGDIVAVSLDSDNNAVIAFNYGDDILISKFDIDTGYELSYYELSGSSWETATDIAVDSQDRIYITGYTSSEDFPVVNPLFEKQVGEDAFLCVLDSSCEDILFSTFIGGSFHDRSFAMDLDESDNIFLAGMTSSNDFPVVNPFINSYKKNHDGFILEINADWSELLYSSFIGGSDEDYITSIDVTSEGNIAACGYTESINFPNTEYDSEFPEKGNAFVFVMDLDSSNLVFSKLLGGSEDDSAKALLVDPIGQIYMTGETLSDDFPQISTQISNMSAGGRDLFVTKISSSHDVVYSIIIGGLLSDYVHNIAMDDYGGIIAIGETSSDDFPILNAPYDEHQGQTDVILFKIADLTDSDNDTINDYSESLYKTNRFKIDSDDDLIPDNYEVEYGLNPREYDSQLDEDLDGLSNLVEYQIGTYCNVQDSDSDSYSDWFEYTFGFDPLNDNVTPFEALVGSPVLFPALIGVASILLIGFIYIRKRMKSMMFQRTQREDSEIKEAMDELNN